MLHRHKLYIRSLTRAVIIWIYNNIYSFIYTLWSMYVAVVHCKHQFGGIKLLFVDDILLFDNGKHWHELNNQCLYLVVENYVIGQQIVNAIILLCYLI